MDKIITKDYFHKFSMATFSVIFHKIGFWFLVVFLCGFLSGNVFSQKLVDMKLQSSVKLGGVVIDQKVFDLKPRM
jgi:hypothetical protein